MYTVKFTAAYKKSYKLMKKRGLDLSLLDDAVEELREPAIYTSIISAVAGGAVRLSEISGKAGEDTNVCATYIKNLINLGIIEKETHYLFSKSGFTEGCIQKAKDMGTDYRHSSSRRQSS